LHAAAPFLGGGRGEIGRNFQLTLLHCDRTSLRTASALERTTSVR
jgi:hypothetical protein